MYCSLKSLKFCIGFLLEDKVNFVPDRSVITASHGQGFGGVHRQGPELAFTMALHDEKRLGAIMHHHLEYLTVLSAHQDVVTSPAHAAHWQS